MTPFNVIKAKNLKDAVALKAKFRARAKIIAGGTDCLVRWKDDIGVPEIAISIFGLKELKGIALNGNRVSIGALSTFTEIVESKIVNRHGGVLVAAVREIGALQIRNMGTIGGNVANASPSGDSIPALMVLGADIIAVGEKGSRRIPVTAFFTGPGKHVLRPDEIIKSIEFKKTTGCSFFLKLGPRKAQAIAKVSAAGLVECDRNRIITAARVALGAVAATVIRIPDLEHKLTGQVLTAARLPEIQKLAAAAAKPISDIRSTAGYRSVQAGVLVRRGFESILVQSGTGLD